MAATRMDEILVAFYKIAELHTKNVEVHQGRNIEYCEHCAELCHSWEGLRCEYPHDGAWPCPTMKILEKWAKDGNSEKAG